MFFQSSKALNIVVRSNTINDSKNNELFVIEKIIFIRKNSKMYLKILYAIQVTSQFIFTISFHDNTFFDKLKFCKKCDYYNNEHKHQKCRICNKM